MFTNKPKPKYKVFRVETLQEAKNKVNEYARNSTITSPHIQLNVTFARNGNDPLLKDENETFNILPPICQNIKIKLITKNLTTKNKKEKAAQWILNWQKWVKRTLIKEYKTVVGNPTYMPTNVGVRQIHMDFNTNIYQYLQRNPKNKSERESIRQLQNNINKPNVVAAKGGPLIAVNLFAEDNVQPIMPHDVWETQCFFALNDKYAQQLESSVCTYTPTRKDKDDHYATVADTIGKHLSIWEIQVNNDWGHIPAVRHFFHLYADFANRGTVAAFRSLQLYVNKIAANIERKETHESSESMQEECKRLVETDRMKRAAEDCIHILATHPKLRLPLYMFGAVTFLIYQADRPLPITEGFRTYFTNQINTQAKIRVAKGVTEAKDDWTKERQQLANEKCTDVEMNIFAPEDEDHAQREIAALKTFRNFAPPVVQKITIGLRRNDKSTLKNNQTCAQWMAAWAKWMVDNLMTTITIDGKKMVMPTNVGTTTIQLKHDIEWWDPNKVDWKKIDGWKEVQKAMHNVNTPNPETHQKSATLQQFHVHLTKNGTKGQQVRDEMPKGVWYQQCLFAVNDVANDYLHPRFPNRLLKMFMPQNDCSKMAKNEMTTKADHNYTEYKAYTREHMPNLKDVFEKAFQQEDFTQMHELWTVYESFSKPNDEEGENDIHDFVRLHQHIQLTFDTYFQNIVQRIPKSAEDKFLEKHTRQMVAREVQQVMFEFIQTLLTCPKYKDYALLGLKWPLYTYGMSILLFHMHTLADVANIKRIDARN